MAENNRDYLPCPDRRRREKVLARYFSFFQNPSDSGNGRTCSFNRAKTTAGCFFLFPITSDRDDFSFSCAKTEWQNFSFPIPCSQSSSGRSRFFSFANRAKQRCRDGSGYGENLRSPENGSSYGIERVVGLIEEKDLGGSDDGSGDGDSLLLPAG
ncbi:hypothetical protein KSP40_PGU017389 [Platanthera guangdongensis]|uniref:Uncharacterized protein n=1 Tax=Platanthera guangdongensis TaxID=2320717 RepID=A0ABR2M5Z7_9ASPA